LHAAAPREHAIGIASRTEAQADDKSLDSIEVSGDWPYLAI
jgi:hypothetical protein